MSEMLSKFDGWVTGDDGPAALVIREHLMPVEGTDGVLFPPTFAAGDNFAGGYNIDPADGESGEGNVCLIDSVGAQANRLEPMFAEARYAALVPQINIKAGEKAVSLLEAGHRAGDAIVRCTALQKELEAAFKAVRNHDAEPLAKIAPTSLVFGVWDSRNTQVKAPRLIASTIRAFNVRKLTRGAVYVPPLDYAELEVFSEEDKAKAEGDSKSPLAKRGFVHNPASGAHGGVIASAGIRRDATLSVAALRLLSAGKDEKRTLALRRYVLGLALVAFTRGMTGYLRQGCNLVLDPDKPREYVEVHHDGRRVALELTHDEALAYAGVAAKAFGVGASREVEFDKALAKQDVAGDGEKAGKKSKKAK